MPQKCVNAKKNVHVKCKKIIFNNNNKKKNYTLKNEQQLVH